MKLTKLIVSLGYNNKKNVTETFINLHRTEIGIAFKNYKEFLQYSHNQTLSGVVDKPTHLK